MIEVPIDGFTITEQPVRDFEPDITLTLPPRAEGFRGGQSSLFGGPITDELVARGVEPERTARAVLRSKWRFESLKDEDAWTTLNRLRGQRLPSERFMRRWLPTGKQVLNLKAFFPKP